MRHVPAHCTALLTVVRQMALQKQQIPNILWAHRQPAFYRIASPSTHISPASLMLRRHCPRVLPRLQALISVRRRLILSNARRQLLPYLAEATLTLSSPHRPVCTKSLLLYGNHRAAVHWFLYEGFLLLYRLRQSESHSRYTSVSDQAAPVPVKTASRVVDRLSTNPNPSRSPTKIIPSVESRLPEAPVSGISSEAPLRCRLAPCGPRVGTLRRLTRLPRPCPRP
jgi:hypothetical protein